MPGTPENPPPPSDVPPTGKAPETSGIHPLEDVSHRPLSNEEREQALTGTHPAQQGPDVVQDEGNKVGPPSIRGVAHEQLMQLSPGERMEYVSQLPPERWQQTAKQLEVPIPIAGGAVEGGEEDTRTPFGRLLDERDGIIATTGSYATLTAEGQQRVNEIDEQIGTLVRTAQRLSGFKILPRENADANYDAIYQRAILAEGILATRDPNLQGVIIYFVNRAQSRVIGDPSLASDERDWEWRPPLPEAPIEVDILNPTIEMLTSGEPHPPRSEFEVALYRFRYFSRLTSEDCPPSINQQVFQQGLEQSRANGIRIIDMLINQANNDGALRVVREDMKTLYRELRTRYEFRYGSLRDKIQHVYQEAARYRETFWQLDNTLRGLRGRYEGTGEYLFPQVAIAIEKDLRKFDLDPREIGDLFLQGIKRERNRERVKEPKFQRERGGYWYEFHWAESEEDIIPSVQDWLDKRINEIPKGRRDKVHEYIEEKMREGSDMLSRLRTRLEQEGHDISEKNPTYVKAKILMESHLNILGGERLLYRGGFDYYINYLDNFANDFINKEYQGHFDVVYLSDEMVPLMLHQLSEEDGKYWRGCEDTEEKPSEGKIRYFQNKRRGQIEKFAATHRLFLTKADFENRSIGFDDRVEQLLLDLSGEESRLQTAGDLDGARRIKLRTGVFQRIRDRLDIQDGLFTQAELVTLRNNPAVREERRQAQIRERIIREMEQAIPNFNRNQLPLNDSEQLNKTLWKWVGDYNKQNRDADQPEWLPSEWDRLRLGIKEPERLLARALSKQELEAMYEEVDSSGLSLAEIEERRERIKKEGGENNLTDEQIKNQLEEFEGELKELRDNRLNKAKSNFKLARSTQIFFGLASRYGGTRIRFTDQQGKFERFKPVFAEVRDRLKQAINEEAEKIRRGEIRKEDSVFLATHALRELGIAGDLPIWSFNAVGDEATIDVVAKALTDYGARIPTKIKLGKNLEEGPDLSITHDDKETFLYDVFERARRAMKKIQDDVASEFMDDHFYLKDRQGNFLLDKKDNRIQRRIRLNHKGGNIDLRRIFDARYITSTSGGVALPELISQVADLGVHDLAWEMGQEDLRGLAGYIYRRDEYEYQDQAFWDTLDAPNYKDRLAGAEIARKYLVGGTIEGQGRVPGLLNEPFSLSSEIRDFLLDENNWRDNERIPNLDPTKLKPKHLDFLTVEGKDRLLKVVVERLKYLIGYMDSRRYVSNRLGRATRTWEYDNTLIWYAFRRAARASFKDDESMWGYKKLDYAGFARSDMMLAFYDGALSSATYHTLFGIEREELVKKGIEPFVTEEKTV